jgi:hypothetical protein
MRRQNEERWKSCLTFSAASREFTLCAPWYGSVVEHLVYTDNKWFLKLSLMHSTLGKSPKIK